MADVMQFIRELFESAPPSMGLQGMIMHAIQIEDLRPEDPALFMIQADIDGYLYTDMVMTRDPDLLDMQEGDQAIFSIPLPGAEGYPAFMMMHSVSKVSVAQVPVPQVQQKPQQVTGGATGPVPPAPMAPPSVKPPVAPPLRPPQFVKAPPPIAPLPPNVPPPAKPGQNAVQAQGAHVQQVGDRLGVGSYDVEQEVPAPGFDPNARDQKRIDQQKQPM